MKALILAAGYATRLYPLTKEFPKPLLTVNKRPIINYIIDKLEPQDKIDEIIVVTNSKFISHFRRWAGGLKLQKDLSLVDDLTSSLKDRRGAVGDMHFIIERKRIRDDLLVIGGDNLFDGDLNNFITFSKLKKKSPVIGAYDVKSLKKAKLYGVMKIDKKDRIVDFHEKPKKPKSTLAAMCLYYFPREKLSLIKEYLKNRAKKLDTTGSYIDWLRRKIAIYAFVFGGRWYDIGDHQFYQEAEEKFSK